MEQNKRQVQGKVEDMEGSQKCGNKVKGNHGCEIVKRTIERENKWKRKYRREGSAGRKGSTGM